MVMKPRHEQMHENRHKRHAGPFNAGHKRKPGPTDRDLIEEYGWKIEEEADVCDCEYFEDWYGDGRCCDRPKENNDAG